METIAIVIEPRAEPFQIQQETLIDRWEAMTREWFLDEPAMRYLTKLRPSNSTRSFPDFEVSDQPKHISSPNLFTQLAIESLPEMGIQLSDWIRGLVPKFDMFSAYPFGIFDHENIQI
jgi:hypothetical protein